MKYNPEIHKRKSIRLKGYDYSQAGLYFITICVQNRECLFGKIAVGATLMVAPNNSETETEKENEQPQKIAPTQKNMGDTENDTRNDGEISPMILNDAGKMIEMEWLNLKNRFPHIELHEYVVMPNHFHGILEIVGATLVVASNNSETETEKENGQPQKIAPTPKTVGDMMGAFKSITTVEYIRGVKNLGWKPFDGKLWQRDYYEHIIRDERAYQAISNYILNNPAKWQEDKFHKTR